MTIQLDLQTPGRISYHPIADQLHLYFNSSYFVSADSQVPTNTTELVISVPR